MHVTKSVVAMGIHMLNEFLRKKTPDAFRRVRTKAFARTRIAVDAPLWSYSAFSAAYASYIQTQLTPTDLLSSEPFGAKAVADVRDSVLTRARQFVGDLLARGITPLFVFDGTSVPEKTGSARQRRAARKAAIDSRIAAARAHLNELPPENRRHEELEALRNLLKQNPPVNPKQDLVHLKTYLTKAGVPCLDAPDEAEKFCAYLAAKGLASASWTTDTDSYAFGAPIFITGYDPVPRGAPDADGRPPTKTWYRATHFTTIMPPIAMAALSMSRAQFTDLCIMFECDFNSRIEGIGPVRAYKMLETARKKAPDASRLIEIAAVDSPDLPWHILNAERCRNVFLDDAECARVLELTGSQSLNLDEDKARREFRGQYEEWLRICGSEGPKCVKIRGPTTFSPLT